MTARNIPMKPGPARSGRRSLLAGCGLIAIVACAGAAHAQAAFQGNATVSAGSVAYSSPNADTDVFTVRTPSAILDWTPYDTKIGGGPIAFLPDGKTGIFQSSTSTGFTVLNRINPADTGRPVEFDGHVVSQYVDAASGAASRAGSIWFYTPGGIIIGATGAFDVGSLILTTNAIDTSNGVPAPGGTLSFRGVAGSTAGITLLPGARINATAANSYVALVAPRIDQGGTVNVNGSVGYLAAEAADVTIDAGLFTITNAVGAQVAPGGETVLTHTGTTTGAASTGAGDPHHIYMIAVPKNDAVTMLVSGTVGYQAAASASVVNGDIVLGAGYDQYANAVGGGQASDIRIGGGTFSSDITARATGNFAMASTSGDLRVGNVTAQADKSLALLATGDHRIDGGDISFGGFYQGANGVSETIGVDAGSTLALASLAANATAGVPAADAGSVTMTVAGTATVDHFLALQADSPGTLGGAIAGAAGTADLTVDGGALTVGIQTRLTADAATGGTTRLTVANGGRANLSDVVLSAQGDDRADTQETGYRGGTALIQSSSDGAITITGTLTVNASAAFLSDPNGLATVTGGSASLIANGGTIIMTDPNAVGAISAVALGGNTATGGTTLITAGPDGAITAAGITLVSQGLVDSYDGLATRASQGGTAIVSTTGGAITITGASAISANAEADGGRATGGTALLDAAAGTITVAGPVDLRAVAHGGFPPSIAVDYDATGGLAQIDAGSGTATLGAIALDASAYGANPSGDRESGDAVGGTARITTTSSTGAISATGLIDLLADGFAGDDEENLGIANGTGGTTEVIARGGTIAFNADAGGYSHLSMIPDGMGGHAAVGGRDVATQGIGQAGTVRLIADDGGIVSIAGSAYLSPYGDGGGGGAGAVGGAGIGGTVTVATGTLDGGAGTIRFGAMDLDAGAFGGVAGAPGGATAGTVSVIANAGGTIAGTTLTIENYADGAAGYSQSGAAGGAASGGTTSLAAVGGTISIGDGTGGGLTIADLNVGGLGYDGGAGGAATGGTTTISASGTGQLIGTAWTITGGATGGDGGAGLTGAGGAGGNATGGAVSLAMSGGTATIGTLTVAAIDGAGAGGAGAGGADPSDPALVRNGFAGGNGGAATGGTATIALTGGTLATGPLTLTAATAGGAGGSGGVAAGAATGGAGGAGSAVGSGGMAGSGDGGVVLLATDDGGNLALGDVRLVADALAGSGGAAGGITIQTAAATLPAITMASLTSSNAGAVSAQQLLVQAAAPITVAGAATFAGGTGAAFTFTGSGGLDIGGAATVAGFSSIAIAQTDTTGAAIRAASVDIGTAGDIALSQADPAAGSASIATTGAGDLSLTAGGAIGGNGVLVSAGGDVTTDAAGAIGLGSVSAGDSFTATTAGGIAVQSAVAGTAGSGVDFAGAIGLNAGDAITLGSGTAFSSIGLLSTGGGVSAASLVAGSGGPAFSSVAVLAPGTVALGTVQAPNLLYVGGPAALAGLGSDPTGAQILAAILAAGPVATGADVGVTSATAGRATLAAGTNLTIGDLKTTAGGALLGAGGTLTASRLVSAAAVTATSSAGAVDLEGLLAPGGVTATGAAVTLDGSGDLHVLSATATSGRATLFGATSLVVDAVSATGGIVGGSGGTAHFGDLTTSGGIQLAGGAGLVTGTLHATGSIGASSTNGAVSIGDAESVGGVVRVAASGDIAIGNVRAAGSIYLTGGGAITAGSLTAGIGPLLPGESGGGGSTDSAPGGIATGFDQFSIAACDDCSTPEVLLPFAVNFFGTGYADTYVSNNGYITFQSGQGTYTPSGLGADYSGQPIIAAFFADVDTRGAGSALATYGTGTYAGRQAFAATWNGVGYYPAQADKLNNFQIVLTNRADTGTGNFDIYFNYTNISWETGSASGGVNGFGGTSAAAGYNAGTGNQPGTFFELAGSRINGSFLNGGPNALAGATNDGTPGQFLFTVRNGQVTPGGASEPPTIHVSNLAAGNTANVTLGALSADAVEVHGAGHVTVGAVAVADHGSGIAAPGNPFATVLDSTSGLIAGDISGAGFVALGAAQGDVSTGTITTASSVSVLASGAVSLGAVSTGRGATDSLFISNPSVLTSDPALSGFAYGSILSGTGFDPTVLAARTPARTGGAINIAGPVSTGSLLAASGGSATFDAIDAADRIAIDSGAGIGLGAATAANDASLSAFGLIDLNGSLDATTITLSSADIAIGADAQLGSARTTALRLTNGGSGRTFLGAGGGEGDYQLSAAELANVHAAAITIDTPRAAVSTLAGASNLADVVIGDVALAGAAGLAGGESANLIGDGGTLGITTPGTIQLTGQLVVSHLGAGNRVNLTAGQTIQGDLPAAGITLADAAGGLAGTLSLAADRIVFATPAAQQALSLATTQTERRDILATSDGVANTSGYISANTVSFTVGSALLDQNSGIADGTNADRAGITAGLGGLAIAGVPADGGATVPIDLVLNARIQSATGLLTGSDAVDPVLHAATVAFSDKSTINGCPVDGTTCSPIATILRQIQPVQDVVQQIGLPSVIGNSTGYVFQTPQLIAATDLAPLQVAPLIDEPVTGAGNDSLWVGVGTGKDQPVTPPAAAKPPAP